MVFRKYDEDVSLREYDDDGLVDGEGNVDNQKEFYYDNNDQVKDCNWDDDDNDDQEE